jgi:hypothetical protein
MKACGYALARAAVARGMELDRPTWWRDNWWLANGSGNEPRRVTATTNRPWGKVPLNDIKATDFRVKGGAADLPDDLVVVDGTDGWAANQLLAVVAVRQGCWKPKVHVVKEYSEEYKQEVLVLITDTGFKIPGFCFGPEELAGEDWEVYVP